MSYIIVGIIMDFVGVALLCYFSSVCDKGEGSAFSLVMGATFISVGINLMGYGMLP